MKLTEHRWAHVIWCDDIRQEVGNKPSFMGVYTGEMVVPTRPAILARFAAHVTVGTPWNRPFQKLVLRVMRNDADEPLGSMELNEEQLRNMAVETSNGNGEAGDNNPSKCRIVHFALQFGALQINETTEWLKLWVDTEDEPLESFKLKFVTEMRAMPPTAF